MAVAPRGHRHRGRANNPFFYFTASRMAVAPRGHRHRGRANNPFFYFTASRMAVAPRGRRHRGRANNPGCAGHAKGRVDVTAATHYNDGGKRALWMLAKRSKMSERSQCQDEGEQRPWRANSGGFMRDQQSTANPNLCSAEEIKGRERMQGICMPERPPRTQTRVRPKRK